MRKGKKNRSLDSIQLSSDDCLACGCALSPRLVSPGTHQRPYSFLCFSLSLWHRRNWRREVIPSLRARMMLQNSFWYNQEATPYPFWPFLISICWERLVSLNFTSKSWTKYTHQSVKQITQRLKVGRDGASWWGLRWVGMSSWCPLPASIKAICQTLLCLCNPGRLKSMPWYWTYWGMLFKCTGKKLARVKRAIYESPINSFKMGFLFSFYILQISSFENQNKG